jgi:trimethylamine---corrinoid protein Co-methyltransferase
MKSSKFKVLDDAEIRQIHEASMALLEETGIKVALKKMRSLLHDCGCTVDEETKIVRFPSSFVEKYLAAAPKEFILCGADSSLIWPVNTGSRLYSGLGTPSNMYDLDTLEYRPATFSDLRNHMILIDGLENIQAGQTDIWPSDLPMHTCHVEALRTWATDCRKSFGMGAFGVMATNDIMEMMMLAMGGKQAVKDRHPYLTIVSVHSPLSTAQMQLEGLWILAECGQPALMSPEAIAGMTAPVTLAGLLVQHNAEVLSHILMAQAVNPGTPVMYGSVSTIAEMKKGGVALGAVETGMLSAASAQLAHYYGIPCRCVAGTTEAKDIDLQCGIEREHSIILAALAGVNLVTCAGTIESTCAGANELTVIDNEIISMAERIVRGIEVSPETLALDLIRKVGPDGNYIAERHTHSHFRKEHFIPRLAERNKRDSWEKDGRPDMRLAARQEAKKILAAHKPRGIDERLSAELDRYVETVSARTLEDFFAAEWEG